MKLLLDTGESSYYHNFDGIEFCEYFNDIETDDIKTIKNEIKSALEDSTIVTRAKRGRQPKGTYINVPAGLSISFSSFKDKGQKIGLVYQWALCINYITFTGVTINQLIDLFKLINKIINKNDTDVSLCIYCDKLPIIYQWIKSYVSMTNTFETSPRKVLSCNFKGIELRDFESLAGVTVNDIVPIKKNGEKRPDGTITPDNFVIPDIEVNSARIITAYINKKIEEDGNIASIPYTKTSYVRRQFRKHCIPNSKKDEEIKKQRARFRTKIKRLKLDEKLYRYSKRALQGGLMCLNNEYKGKILKNVSSFDIVSSYIAELCSKEYPSDNYIEKVPKNVNEFEYILERYLSIFDVSFYNVKLRKDVPTPIWSLDNCFEREDINIVNNKLVSAKMITTTMTSVDFDTFRNFYEWEKFSVGTMYYFEKDYLPKPLIEEMLTLYKEKTALKGVAGKEDEYENTKSRLDSIYGMMVTDIKYQADSLEDYNKNFSRFIYYPWGVFCTAYARRTLCMLIKECGKDFVYSDTDCVKMLNMSNHIDYINKYSEYIKKELEKVCNRYRIDKESISPKNILGQPKQLGSWGYEGTYDTFKALKPKMYMYSIDNKISVTCAGISKKGITDFMSKCDDPFNTFADKLEIPKEYSGKKVYSYSDEPVEGYIKDYKGNIYHYKGKTSVYMESVPARLYEDDEEFKFNQFKQFIKNKSVEL